MKQVDIENSAVKMSLANFEDCEAIIHLQRLAYQSEAKLYNDWTLPALTQTVESLREELLHSRLLKAEMDEKIIGAVRAKYANGMCHIGRLIVCPDYQGRGIGTELLRAIEAQCAEAAHYELFTGHKSLDNIRLYEREGYEIHRKQTISEKITLVYLRKAVTAANKFM